jgi:hypothetical protein
MRRIAAIFTAGMIMIFLTFGSSSCDIENPIIDSLEQALGWYGLGGDLGDDLSGIEDDINFGQGTLPSSVDLTANFPPIGDQGQYGTCVAWATGYNHRSYILAKSEGRTSFSNSQMFSPKYLFWAVPSSQKGADCNGTGFEAAYDVMLSKGISTLQTTPYTDLGDCSGSTSAWDAAALSFKLESYREIDVDINTIKESLAQGKAVSIGAKLGDNFMSWDNTGDVHYSDTYGYSGQHAYHAMIVAGYDDNRGNNGAFKVVNSWGNTWGNAGYIWVDYNFFVSGDFCFCAFVATGELENPDGDGDNVVDDPNSGKDLMAWELYDEDNGGGTNRVAKYNAFNSGTEEIPASTDWNMLYIYYNAYNANDYGIMLYDYYSDDYGTYGDDGDLYPVDPGACYGDQNWYNHINIAAGYSVAQVLYGGEDARFSWPYTMPQITGEYYLVLIVDGFNAITEFDETNNYFYLTDSNGEPISFINGVMQETPAKNYNKTINPRIGEDSPLQTVKSEKNLNTYSTQDIYKLILNRLETGDIQKKANEFIKNNKNINKKTNG